MLSLVCIGFLLMFLFPPTIKNLYYRLITQSVPLTKSTDENQDLVPGHCTAARKRMGQIQRTNLISFTYDCYHWLWIYIMMEQQQWGWLSSVSTGFHFYSGLFRAESEIQSFDLNSGFRLVQCLNVGKGCYHRQPLHYLCCCLLWISHAASCFRKIKVVLSAC